MPKYALIRVEQFYDYVEGASCDGSFDTYEEAFAFLDREKNESYEMLRRRNTYIDEYVNAIELPETNYNGWIQFLPKYLGPHHSYIAPKDFREHLKGGLRSGTLTVHAPDFNPPPQGKNMDAVFIVEIP